MTTTTVTTPDSTLPNLTMEGPAHYHDGTDRDTLPDVFSQPYPLSNLEQRLRLDFLRGGLNAGYRCSEQTIKDAYDAEAHTLSAVSALKDSLDGAREPFLKASLEDAIDDIENFASDRSAWFYQHVPQSRDTAVKNALKILYNRAPIEACINDSIEEFSLRHVQDEDIRLEFEDALWDPPALFFGRVVVPDTEDPDAYDWSPDLIVSESELDNAVPPSAFGVELPAPLMVCESPSGSQYAFVPHSGTIECGGPFAQADHCAHKVLCKHMVAGLLAAARNDSFRLPHHGGIEVPDRCRRLVAPDIMAEHTSTTSPQ